MKTLLALVMLFASNSDAAEVCVKNNLGGCINFTTKKTDGCKPDKFFAYATSAEGRVAFTGCWIYLKESKKAFVFWKDGDVYEYKID